MFGFNELSTPVRAIIAFAIVLVLVVLAGLVLRKVAGGRLRLSGQSGRARQPRLGVVDIFELDRQRQLVLLRRDNVEHLVMIGGPNDVVVEANIVRATRSAAPPVAEPVEPAPIETAKPVMPAPVAIAPPQAAPLPLPVKPDPAPAIAPIAESAPTPAPAIAATAAVALSVSKAPAQQPAPAPQAPPGVAQPPTAFDAELERAMANSLTAAPEKPAAAKNTAPKPIIEPIAPSPAAKVSKTELDDMTKQLEEALKRPFSGVRPASALPEPKAVATPASPQPTILDDILTTPEPEKPARQEAVKTPAPAAAPPGAPAAAAPAQQPPSPPPQKTAPAAASVKPDTSKPEAPKAAAQSPVPPPSPEPAAPPAGAPMAAAVMAAASVTAVPVAATPTPEPSPLAQAAPPRQGETPPPKPGPKHAAPAEPDPFSVDAIEAEFARLLHRNAPPKS